jgi:hypothetical protein
MEKGEQGRDEGHRCVPGAGMSWQLRKAGSMPSIRGQFKAGHLAGIFEQHRGASMRPRHRSGRQFHFCVAMFLMFVLNSACATQSAWRNLRHDLEMGKGQDETLQVHRRDFSDPRRPSSIRATSDGSSFVRNLMMTDKNIYAHVQKYGTPSYFRWAQDKKHFTFEFFYPESDRLYRFESRTLKISKDGIETKPAETECIPEYDKSPLDGRMIPTGNKKSRQDRYLENVANLLQSCLAGSFPSPHSRRAYPAIHKLCTCFLGYKSDDPAKYHVRLRIRADGKVGHVTEARTRLHETFGHCAASSIEGLEMPRPPGPTDITIDLTDFLFDETSSGQAGK